MYWKAFNRHKKIITFLLIFWMVSVSVPAQENPTGDEVADMAYYRDDGVDRHQRMVMTLIDKNGKKKERRLEVWEKDYGDLKKRLLRFTAPASIAGTGFLNIEKEHGSDEQFLFLPELRRSRRIAASQRNARFVNTDFTYEDMERRHPGRSMHRFLKSEQTLNRNCWVIESISKNPDDSQYRNIISWVDRESYLVLKAEFYDKKGRLAKHFEVQEIKRIDGIWTATKVLMKDVLRHHSTLLTLTGVEYNRNLPDKLFTVRNLEKY